MCLLIVMKGMPDAHKRTMASTLSEVLKRLKSLSFKFYFLHFYLCIKTDFELKS